MEQQSPQQHTPNAVPTSTQVPHILLVDDDADILDVLALIFQEDGFRTSACTTSQEAMSVLDAAHVHLLITDRRLLSGDGLELVRYVYHRFNNALPVILLTAAGRPTAQEDMRLLEEVGARVVSKPFDIDRLAQLARELLAD
jgi:two-component system response regulator GlrR